MKRKIGPTQENRQYENEEDYVPEERMGMLRAGLEKPMHPCCYSVILSRLTHFRVGPKYATGGD